MATTSSNYSGRKTDLFIFEGAAPVGERQIALQLLDGGKITTGIQKLAQTFASIFLTEQGSIPMLPDRGTGFITAVRQQRITNAGTLQSEFILAASLVQRFMSLQADLNNSPNDERLNTVTLTNFTIDKLAGKISLKVSLVSLAGASLVIFLPIPVALK